MKEVWSELEVIDPSLHYGGQYQKGNLSNFRRVVAFLNHCCQARHYSFTIQKCGETSCTMCKLVHMHQDSFEKLHFLPDAMLGEIGHYKEFRDVYGTETTEEYRPSMQTHKSRQKTLPFTASVQHVKNADTIVYSVMIVKWDI